MALTSSTGGDMPHPPVAEAITAEQALANAIRLLRNAEAETNLALMERLEKLADTWVNIAVILSRAVDD